MAATAVSSDGRKLVKDKSLREILDGITLSQRQDIDAFSKGHLNEAKLPKPPDKAKHKTWKSATKPAINLVPKSSLPPSKQDNYYEDSMKQTMLNFSIGTSCAVPAKQKPKPTPISRTSNVAHIPSASSKASAQGRKGVSKKADKVLVEELLLPESMLKRTDYYEPQSITNQAADMGRLVPDTDVLRTSQAELIQQKHLPPLVEHMFVPSHLDAVTKKDQFHQMKMFEVDVLRKQDATEQNVMSGVKAVEHLEAKLHQDLDNLQYNGYGPNFHRLQVYSNVFEDLICESSTFGFILDTIKNQYDEYIASLLDGQTAKHKVLQNQVEQLSMRGMNNSQLLQKGTNRVCQLEQEASSLLDENQRLRRELQIEEELLNKPKEEEEITPRRQRKNPVESSADLTEQIEHLKVAILDKLDTMNHLKTKLRTECVPSTVCSHLEQCVKETEVEIQKLTTQKEFFDRSIGDMEEELQTAIETADTTEKDARRVWKRITAVKSVDRSHKPPGAGVTTTGPGGPPNTRRHFGDSDEEQDEEKKWSWYIS